MQRGGVCAGMHMKSVRIYVGGERVCGARDHVESVYADLDL